MTDIEVEELHEVGHGKPSFEMPPSTPSDDGAERDAFEDATGSPDAHSLAASPVSSTRSLTDRRRSRRETPPSLAPLPADDAESPETPRAKPRSKLQDRIAAFEGRPVLPDAPVAAESRPSLDEEDLESPALEPIAADEAEKVLPPLPHRHSQSSMANVELNESDTEQTPSVTSSQNASESRVVSSRSSSKSTFQGLSNVLPAAPWSPPAQPVQPHPPVAAPPPARKLTSPFSWLSRSKEHKEAITSPPLPSVSPPAKMDRRESTGTLNSNPEMMLSKLDDVPEDDEGTTPRPARISLRDRFKLLRMREEAGIAATPDEERVPGALAGLIGRTTGLTLGVASPSSLDDSETTSLHVHPPSPNPLVSSALPPGTAAGVAAGPSAMPEAGAVDWDLWQSVVYEGPAAVARTSPEELNRAIAAGIPNAIRGVVWQVLAHSKNEELELMYRDLVNRGTDKDKDRQSLSNSSGSKDKDSAMSSASSVHSDHSTPATTVTNGQRSPSPPGSDVVAKQLALAAEKKKKDAAALQKLEKTIRRDMGARTSYSKFAASAGLQDGLFGLCKAYALYDEDVGYAQGMNFIAMPLLFNMPEEEAFCLLVRMMNQYHLRDLFVHDMPGLHMHLYQFERLLEDFEPALCCHLRRRQVTPNLYATQWFLTLFAYRFPLQLVLRIYDLILSEGLEAILKFGIVLMQKNAATLLAMNDMVALTSFLKEKIFDVYIDQTPSAGSILESGFFGSSGASIDKEIYRADMLIQDACAVKITPETLKTYTAEWEEKTRLEQAQAAELEHLRSSNVNLQLKVRRLEERVEAHDREHAQLATELVHAKVENEELKDKNESLTGQVEELRAVVEKQPGEVEERLKSEMERIIKRNEEVHMENSRLEEEMAEMEKTLVETKMQYAEVNAQHETLTRKWTDLKKALD